MKTSRMCCCRRFLRRRIGCGIRGLDGGLLEGGIGAEVGLFESRRFGPCKNLVPLSQAKTLDPGVRRDDVLRAVGLKIVISA